MPALLPISGYILAGGHSSRMGTDKALIQLAGKPLIARAVAKLRSICADVHILSSNSQLGAYAPLIPDLHPNCGPVGGAEAALAHSQRDWNLLLAVDMPFLPAAILRPWAAAITAASATYRVAMFSVDGRPQPAASLLHRDIAPSIAAAVALEEFALFPALEAAANVVALQSAQPLDQVLSTHLDTADFLAENLSDDLILTPDRRAAQHLWFLNLNTPQDLAIAESNAAALDD